MQNRLRDGEKTFSYPRPLRISAATNLIYDLSALIMAADKPLSGLSILLVEDDADGRDLLSLAFLHAAATVTAASNATDGYALYTASPPAVVVTDIAMPHRDGFWLFNAIRSIPGTTPPPVVAVTALAMPKEREAILAAGFAAYLVKPVDPDEVIAVVARCVGRG